MKKEKLQLQIFIPFTPSRFAKIQLVYNYNFMVEALQRIGKLTVLELTNFISFSDKDKSPIWKVRCDCGDEVLFKQTTLNKGSIDSCGCSVRSGYKYNPPKIKERCTKPKQSFEKSITIEGVTKTFSQWVEHFGKSSAPVSRQSVYHRLKAGWDPEKAFLLPPGTRDYRKLLGKKFHKLKAVDIDKQGFVICECECGKTISIMGSSLTSGIRSCGCSKHNWSNTLTWSSWSSMLDRCTNSNQPAWKDYGGRGITVCDRWKYFTNFLEDMGERPHGKTLDRIDVNGNYEPGNCRWATPKEQSSNKRNNQPVLFEGELASPQEHLKRKGLSSKHYYQLRDEGASVEEALQKCKRSGHKKIVINLEGKEVPLKEALLLINSPVLYSTALQRISKGWDPYKAVTTPPFQKQETAKSKQRF